jgi:hypothetical protein
LHKSAVGSNNQSNHLCPLTDASASGFLKRKRVVGSGRGKGKGRGRRRRKSSQMAIDHETIQKRQVKMPVGEGKLYSRFYRWMKWPSCICRILSDSAGLSSTIEAMFVGN